MDVCEQQHLELDEDYECSLLLADEERMADIVQPHHHDVLCGRGVTTNRHPGNESFRSLVGLNKELYVSSTKKQKMTISRSIVRAVRSLDPPGRFLEKDPVTGLWSDIGHKKAIEKTSQALRDGAAILRRQLSADLGDPGFLNAVFGDDDENDGLCVDKEKGVEMSLENPVDNGVLSIRQETETAHPLSSKRPVEKMKVVKRPISLKKGHRRTMSNPCSGTASTKHHRRAKPIEPPPSPLVKFTERFSHIPPSPRTPQPKYSVSHPNSPMTWGERVHHYEYKYPGSPWRVPTYSLSDYRPASPSSNSPYTSSHEYPNHERTYPNDYRYNSSLDGQSYLGRPYTHDYYDDSPPVCKSNEDSSSLWSYGVSRYSPHPYVDRSLPSNAHPGYSITPPRSASPSPVSPIPSGPLPPGRHQFSPAGYRVHQPADEWSSPRDSTHYQDPHVAYSPGCYYESNVRRSDRSPRWKPPHSHDYYGTPPRAGYGISSGDGMQSSESNSLAVPSLASDNRYHSKANMSLSSSRVMLPPRRSIHGEMPPRPPTSSPRDFAPPPPSPRYRNVRRREEAPHSVKRDLSCSEDSLHLRLSCEEKKMDYDGEESSSQVENQVPCPTEVVSSCHLNLKLNLRQRSSPSPSKGEDSIPEEEEEDEQKHQGEEVVTNKSLEDNASISRSSSTSTFRASPVSSRIQVVAEGTEAPMIVDDIAMSPISLKRNDPAALMVLPENILSLPISPCGPHDDPFLESD